MLDFTKATGPPHLGAEKVKEQPKPNTRSNQFDQNFIDNMNAFLAAEIKIVDKEPKSKNKQKMTEAEM